MKTPSRKRALDSLVSITKEFGSIGSKLIESIPVDTTSRAKILTIYFAARTLELYLRLGIDDIRLKGDEIRDFDDLIKMSDDAVNVLWGERMKKYMEAVMKETGVALT